MPSQSVNDLIRELKSHADPKRAQNSAWFFKTGPGEYGEGDVFLGLPVPLTRSIVKHHKQFTFDDIKTLLEQPEHEIRLAGCLVLVSAYKSHPREVYEFYMKNAAKFNNWDLVDTTAPHIAGTHLLTRPRDDLYTLATSANLWKRRIAIVSTLTLIKNGQIQDTLNIAQQYIEDPHELIHKATGWMLREVGKVNKTRLIEFLAQHHAQMPAVMRNYAMEHLPSSLKMTIRKQGKLMTKKE